MWRWVSGEAAGEETLAPVVANLHTAAWFYMIAFLKSEALWRIRQPN